MAEKLQRQLCEAREGLRLSDYSTDTQERCEEREPWLRAVAQKKSQLYKLAQVEAWAKDGLKVIVARSHQVEVWLLTSEGTTVPDEVLEQLSFFYSLQELDPVVFYSISVESPIGQHLVELERAGGLRCGSSVWVKNEKFQIQQVIN